MQLSRKSFLALAAGSLAGALSPLARAQAYPSRTITLVVPFPAGAATDAAARLLAPQLQRELGQSVVVENVSGAAGAIAVRRSLKAPPDGYQLHFGTVNDVVLVPVITRPAPYRPQELVPIGKTFVTTLILVASPAVPANNIDELAALLKRSPNSLSLAHPGIGTVQHLAAAAIASSAAFEWTNVPYKGSAPITTDLLGGHVHLAVMTMPSAAPLLATGKVKSLGVLRRERDPAQPQLATINEGRALAGMQFEQWNGLFAPPGTPPEIQRRLLDAVQAAIRSADFRTAQAKAGADTPNATDQESFAREIAADEASYRRIAGALKLE